MSRKGADTKSLIRSVARRQIAERGFEAVSMRDIASAVQVQPSAIYNHFANKHALLSDLMLSHMQSVLDDMQASLSAHADPVAALEAFARAHLLLHIDRKEDVFLAYYEMRSLEGAAQSAVLKLRDAYEHLLRDILEQGETSGAFAISDAAVHARALVAMLTGVTTWYQEGGPLSRRDVTETYVRAAMQSVGAQYRPDERPAS